MSGSVLPARVRLIVRMGRLQCLFVRCDRRTARSLSPHCPVTECV